MGAKRTLQRQLNKCFENCKNNTAIEYGNRYARYKDLDKKSNYIANWILGAGIKKGTFIGVLIEDKLDMITGIIGIIRAGCVFVPLDSSYPHKRIEMMISASDLVYILCDESNNRRLHRISRDLSPIILNDNFYKSNDEYYTKKLDIEYEEEDKIYIYFTSGTTGRPKGILGKNIGLLQFIKWEIREFDINSKFRLSQFTSQCHDPFLRDIFVPLCTGGTICIPRSREIILDTKSLIKWIEDNRINLIHCTPSLFKIFNTKELNHKSFSQLKYILLAGERVKSKQLEKWYGVFKDRIGIVNMYGPTETTLAKLFHRIKREDIKKENIPVGKPITGAKAIILDRDMKICGYGKTGEIYIRTPYRTLGYYKDDKLNKEKFIVNPFNDDHNDIIYKTGDLGRINQDGDIEFLGRMDRQVKIRGFRVELNEIENVLLNHSFIKDAVVVNIQMEDGENTLRAYIVKKTIDNMKKEPAVSEIKEYLSSRLPSYMIPVFFIYLENIPLNKNGKVDYKELAQIGNKNSYEIVEPRNETEKRLKGIWTEVLNVNNIGVKNGFLDIGGHSLNAMKLIQKIYKEFKIKIQLDEIFKNPTIEELSNSIAKAKKSIYKDITRAVKDKYYRLSSAQRRMYLLNQLSKETTDYNMPLVLELEGELNKQRFKEVFDKLIKRHESLRTSFVVIDDEPMQRVHEEIDFNIEYKEMDRKDIEEVIQDFIKPFDLSKVPLFRVSIVNIEKNKYILMTDMHHIIADGTSRRILTSEISKLYNGEQLQALRIQYKDYALWQNEMLTSKELKKQEEYWLERFNGEIPVLNMPIDYQRPTVKSFKGTSIEFKINRELTNKLNNLARKNKATLYMVLLAAYNALLYRYTGQEDIIIGSPTAGRPHIDLQNIIGMFVNTLAMKNNPTGNKVFEDFLLEVKENTLRAYENQNFQFEELVERVDIKRDMGRNPLFDTMLILQNMDSKDIELEKLKSSLYKFKDSISKFDITLSAVEIKEGIYFNLQYCTELFRRETIERLIRHFINILQDAAEYPYLKLKEIKMVSEEEKQHILLDFNKTKSQYPKEKTIHELFEEQVENTPDNIAVVCGNKKLTYRELNESSNQLARLLREKGVGADTIVGMMLERSLEMIISIFGILKSGGALLPIDPKLPEGRKEYMLRDSSSEILLMNDELHNSSIKEFKGYIINPMGTELRQKRTTDLKRISGPENLAYLIYTSGTTGNPKGVMLEHRTLTNLISFQNKHTNMDFKNSKVTQFAAMSFDVCYQEIFSTLLNGGELYILSEDDKNDINLFLEFIEEKKINISFLPTAYFKYLSNYKDYLEKLSNKIKHIIAAGEQLIITDELKKKLRENRIYLHNHYGPSEAHVVTTLTIDPEGDIDAIPPIGKPISNTKLYILSKDNQLQPLGIPGELCIAGDCVGRGYINMEELTKKKFIDNPFNKGERMYKTGDLARWLQGGNIEFLGRIDNQVKIRGYRIELGEIENKLQGHDEIKEAVITAEKAENGDKYLCSYIVPKRKMTAAELRKYLSKELPEYMIPSYFIELGEIPLTKNGKVDTRALPRPKGNINTGIEYEGPRNEREEILVGIWEEILSVEKVGIWEEILSVEKVGINDDFFDLGGHSLKAMTLVSKIHKELNAQIPLQEVFKNPSIKGMSEYIKSSNENENMYNSIKRIEERKYYPLSSAQKRMYILNRFNEEGTNYNMPWVLEIDGELNIKQLENAFKGLIERHEALRTSFEKKEEYPVQIIHREIDFKIEYKEAREEEVENIIEDFIRPFDLSKAPLFKARIVRLKEEKHILMTDMHHIISDGVSVAVLIGELKKLYRGEKLGELRIQYRDYALWQRGVSESKEMKKQGEYWINRFKGEIPQLNLTTDYKRQVMQSFEGSEISFRADKELTEKLKRRARQNKATLYMVLLSAYNALLYRYTGQEDIIVGTPAAGRPHADLQNIIGIFVNTLAMRNSPRGEKTFRELLIEVKENALGAYENQGYQFEELVEGLDIKRDISRNTLFDTMFTLQNMDMEEIEIKGLKIAPYNYKAETSKFDLSLGAVEGEEGIQFSIQYCTRLFKEETVRRFGRHYINILKEISENPEVRLREIRMMSEEEEKQILIDFNDKGAEYPRDRTIHQLFEEQVERTPEKTAVVFEDKELSYRQLNQRANSLARQLRGKGIGPDTIVGIMVERSLEMIVGVLGILKAGGAYLPIDPQYPEERIKYMLEDAKTNVLLTQDKLKDNIEFHGEIISLDDEDIYRNDRSNLDNNTLGNNIIYIIYTSGTTGRPKAILTEHRNVINYIYSFNNRFNLTQEECTLQQSSFTFDAFVEEVHATLLIGGKVVLPRNEQVKDVKSLRKLIEKHGVTILSCSPLILSQFNNLKPMKSVNIFLSSTDALRKEYFSNIIKYSKIYNLYGPTEATVCTTSYNCSDRDNINIPIGKPFSNYKVYILDKSCNPVPLGVPGEIYISGDGIARGYLNNFELTKEKFIDNPFMPNKKMYRTGDMGKWLANGDIEFLGRQDLQVKIRGYRVEIDEVVNQLLGCELVKEAVVIAKEDEKGNKYLCGYFVSDEELTVRELRKHLAKGLPEYMIPAYFVRLENIPLTLNGKIDRRALPEPCGSINTGVEYEEPRNEIEEVLVKLWQEILRVNGRIGINDNFFELGGNSLKLVDLASRINGEFQIEISLMKLFKGTKIKEISKYIIDRYEEDTKASVVLLNKPREEKIFCFPPITGYGLIYNELSNILEDYSLYSFNFIEERDRIEKYIDIITDIQSCGPYILLGYCMGGRLAFKVAKELEKQGYEVGNVIILDGYRQLEKKQPSYQEIQQYESKLSKSIDEDKKYFMFKKEILAKTISYYKYCGELTDEGTINGDIHLITASDIDTKNILSSGWDESTTCDYTICQGFGQHNEMLEAEFGEKNASIITDILSKNIIQFCI